MKKTKHHVPSTNISRHWTSTPSSNNDETPKDFFSATTLPKSPSTHTLLSKPGAKDTFIPVATTQAITKKKNQDLQVKQRALDRWFNHLDRNLPQITQGLALLGIDTPFTSPHWCKRDDIRDPCKICGEVLELNTNTTWQYQPCQTCLIAGCVIPPDETCCGMCGDTKQSKTGLFWKNIARATCCPRVTKYV